MGASSTIIKNTTFFILNWFSDDPDIPQVISASQCETYYRNCDIYLSWSLPNNIAPDDISHFTIYIDGTHVANKTRNVNESLIVIVYRLCSCGSHNISISAVNRCGRSGRSTLVTVDDQLPIPQLTIECQYDSTTTMGRNQIIIMYTCAHIHTHSSYMTLIGMHEMHGRVHPN